MTDAIKVSTWPGAEFADGASWPPPGGAPAEATVAEPAGTVLGSTPAAGSVADSMARQEQAARAEADAQADAQALAEVPATPAEYRMPERGAQDEALGVPEVERLQGVSHAVGLTPGEFSLVVIAGREHARLTAGVPMTQAERELAANHMEAVLVRSHGDDGATAICEDAMRAVRAAKSRDPELGEALHEMALKSRPLLEMLARVGRRGTRRR